MFSALSGQQQLSYIMTPSNYHFVTKNPLPSRLLSRMANPVNSVINSTYTMSNVMNSTIDRLI
jgi:hypothetical protein